MTRYRRGSNAHNDGEGKEDKGTDKYSGGLPAEDRKPWPTHGAYACVKLYHERELDLRRADHRFLAEWKKGVIEDLGGVKEISSFQLSMIDQGVSLLIILGKMSEYVESVGIMGKDGQLAPCLRTSYLAYVNTLRHCLNAAYEQGKRKPKTPDLRDYLENNHQEKEDRNGTQERTDRTGRDDTGG